MNSLTELNNYNNSLSLTYDDQRYGRVVFDRATATNPSIIVNEGETFSLSLGIEIVEVIKYAVSHPTMTVDISSVYASGVRVSWGTLPDGVTVTPDGLGVYVVSGINSTAIWDQIKQPNIVLPTNVPNAFNGNWTYTVKIDYYDENLGDLYQQYTVSVSVLDVSFMTTPLSVVYDPSSSTHITNTPQISSWVDTGGYSEATWTITGTVSATFSIDSFSSSYSSGGTFTYNSGTKGFSIVGTRAQVNSHLSNLYLNSNTLEVDFVLYYALSNSVDTATDTKSQTLANRNVTYFSNLSETTFYYTEDTQTTITGYPQVTDDSYSGTGTYTVEIYPSSTTDVYTLSSSGSGGTTSFNSGTKVLTITGTKTQVNSHLPNITIQPESDVSYPFQLIYKLTTPLSYTSIKVMDMICTSNDTEVSNINVTRSYVGNNGNAIFVSDTPQIIDFDSTGVNTYTITLQSTLGSFSVDDFNFANPYSFTGTKSEVNDLFPTIKFYPTKGVSTNGTISYTQIKNSVTQVSTSFAVNGTIGTYSGSRVVNISATQTFTPTLDDILYAKYAIYIIGAGGGGGFNAGGGGGGGEGLYYYNQSFTPQTYTATVGIGGLGGNGTAGRTDGLDGGDSTFDTFTARGGKGGHYGFKVGTPGAGGASGNGHPGGSGVVNGSRGAGGGGGGNGTGYNNDVSGAGENAWISGGIGQGGDGGPDYWWYTNKDGILTGPSAEWSGGGGGGGAYNNSGNTSSGKGGNNTSPAKGGVPTGGTNNPTYAGNGGGGGSPTTYTSGANGADGWIRLDIYY